VHVASDFETFKRSIADAVERGDAESVREAIHPQARVMSEEHGIAFRELVAGLPVEVWHSDPRIAAAMGGSYRAQGSPRGQSALGYFRAAEVAIAGSPDVPAHCVISVLLGHATALRNCGLLAQARVKVDEAEAMIETRLGSAVPMRIELGARWSLEHGLIDLHEALFAIARPHLEYARGHAASLTRAEHIECLGALSVLDGSEGDLDRALRQVAEARDLAEGTDLLETGFGAPALAAEVMVANERCDLELAARLEPAMIEAGRRNEWEPFVHIVSAQLRALEGHPVVALDVLKQAGQGYVGWDTHSIGMDFGGLMRAAVLTGLGQGDEAWAILQTLKPHDGHPLCPARVVAQLRLRHGDLVGADEAIRDCEALGDAHCGRTLVDIQLIRATIELERGNYVVSDVNADRALVTMARTGARAPLTRIPSGSLFTIATRARERRHRPDAQLMITRILERTADAQGQVETLSPRERLVLAQVQRGLTVAAIAAELYISPNTVKTHLRRLYRKLGVTTREEAIRAARSLGLEREITRQSPGQYRDSLEEPVL
jgi:DNA-binding NarL/FixJ family response regulator